jgi:DNA sulfur modification protein DndD
MIIKKVIIENYLCYFESKEFELSNGLNIILGENGEGKTKFFEAIDWLFNGDSRNLELLVSAKALAQKEINDQFRVRVAITVQQQDEMKTISKSFVVKKMSENECSTSNFTIEGIEENKSGERSQVDGKALLDRFFPPEIRRYSMFKGEADLNIFKNEDALISLINSFSSAKHYDKYFVKGAYLREKAEKAVDDATRSDYKNQQEYKRLESELSRLTNEKSKISVFINSTEDQIRKTEENIQDADKYVSNAEALEMINSRIKNIEDQINTTSVSIDENYTTSLFDEHWVLVNFEKIHQEFATKVSELSAKKRGLQTEFDKQQGIKQGREQAKAELLNNSIPLPTGVPSKTHMEEMLKDEICKVCNRPAKKGSTAHDFMIARLEEYLKSQQPEDGKDERSSEILFKNDYTNRLFSLSVSHEDNLSNLRDVRNKIRDVFEYNGERKKDLEGLEMKLAKELEEREKIVGLSSIGAERLTHVLKNYNGWQRDLKHHNKELLDYKRQIQNIEDELQSKRNEKDGIDTKTANTFLIKTRSILRDVETIFKETKENKFDEFIELLQVKSNAIFERINVEAFTGIIVFTKRNVAGKTAITIELQEEDGTIVHRPNQSLLTSMHISILFAISEIASELREERYPMIFDAPTSSFGETKTAEFLNLIYETDNQKILLIKDFLTIDETTKKLSIKNEFSKVKRHKAFWIFLERPFDRKNLKSINTQRITL